MELAKKLQMALVADGGSVIAQRLYHNFRSFRVFDLSEHKLANHNLLVHPMALQRMAEFLQDQYYHQSQTSKRKPVVLIAPKDENTGRCLVVGFQVAKPGNQGNRLGSAFVQAAEDVRFFCSLARSLARSFFRSLVLRASIYRWAPSRGMICSRLTSASWTRRRSSGSNRSY